jgi:hypothetical protein
VNNFANLFEKAFYPNKQHPEVLIFPRVILLYNFCFGLQVFPVTQSRQF